MALCLSRTLRPAKARSLLRSSKSAEAQNAVKRSSCECTNLQHFELEPTSSESLRASSPQLVAGRVESRGREGGFETPLPTSGPRGAQSHLTERENIPRATGARTSSKKKTAPPLPRAERKPLDQKKKPVPRHQRENQLKEKNSPASGPRGAHSHLTERKNLLRATSARTGSKKKPAPPLARAERKAI